MPRHYDEKPVRLRAKGVPDVSTRRTHGIITGSPDCPRHGIHVIRRGGRITPREGHFKESLIRAPAKLWAVPAWRPVRRTPHAQASTRLL